MKKIILLPALLLLLVFSAQAQTYMDDIVKKSCDCVAKVNPNLKGNEFNMALGVCIIEAAMPYKKQLKKDFDLDMDRIDVEGEKLGSIIGVRMVSFCPDAMMAITSKSEENVETAEGNAEITLGVVTKVEKDFFVVFHVKDETGKTSKYYWISHVDTDFDLTAEYGSLVGKKVEIYYNGENLFDPRIAEYRPHFVIVGLYLAE